MIYLEQYGLEIIIALMAILILYLIYYINTKDTENSKNIRSIATVVEELNREIFYLKKDIKNSNSTNNEENSRMNDEEIYQEIERGVYDMTNPLVSSIKQMQEEINANYADLDSRIITIENGVKQISVPSSLHGNDHEKVISLFKQGVSLETISKELHLSLAEVEFVLKINKIK
jgi:gas vesicle protein